MRVYIGGPSTGPGSIVLRVALVLLMLVLGLAALAIAIVLAPVLLVLFFLFRAQAKRTWKKFRESPGPTQRTRPGHVIDGDFQPKP